MFYSFSTVCLRMYDLSVNYKDVQFLETVHISILVLFYELAYKIQ